jgi:hypothetical protein
VKLRHFISVFLLTACTLPAQQYAISTVAGGAPPPTPAAATTASIGSPAGIVRDAAGNVLFFQPEIRRQPLHGGY